MDELLENSLFKRKHAPEPVSEDTLVNQALSAPIDPNDFNCGTTEAKAPPVSAALQAAATADVPDEAVTYSNL